MVGAVEFRARHCWRMHLPTACQQASALSHRAASRCPLACVCFLCKSHPRPTCFLSTRSTHASFPHGAHMLPFHTGHTLSAQDVAAYGTGWRHALHQHCAGCRSRAHDKGAPASVACVCREEGVRTDVAPMLCCICDALAGVLFLQGYAGEALLLNWKPYFFVAAVAGTCRRGFIAE